MVRKTTFVQILYQKSHKYTNSIQIGLSEPDHPCKTYARQGVRDLINFGRDKIYPVIPQLIVPLKRMQKSLNYPKGLRHRNPRVNLYAFMRLIRAYLCLILRGCLSILVGFG